MKYDIAIIGSGFAGMTAALYAARNGLKAVIFEKYFTGGQIITTMDIENYPGFKSISGFDLVTHLKNQVNSFNVEIKTEEVQEIIYGEETKKIKTNKQEYDAKTVIVSVGCVSRKIGCENEDVFQGKGISYCATCDGNFFKDRDVCVVGGGNTALEDAVYLSSICKTVYIIHRRKEFRGDKRTVEILKNKPNVKFILDSVVKSISGSHVVESITVTNVNSNKDENICVNGIFVAIGQVPSTQMFKESLALDDNGYIVAGEDCHTSIEGVFAAGDVRTKKVRQLVTAAADGAVSASEASNFINGI